MGTFRYSEGWLFRIYHKVLNENHKVRVRFRVKVRVRSGLGLELGITNRMLYSEFGITNL